MKKSKSLKSPVFHLVYSLWHLIQNIFHYFEILSFIDCIYLFCKTILYIDISKENLAKSTSASAVQTETHSFTESENKRIFFLRFPVKNTNPASSDVNRPE